MSGPTAGAPVSFGPGAAAPPPRSSPSAASGSKAASPPPPRASRPSSAPEPEKQAKPPPPEPPAAAPAPSASAPSASAAPKPADAPDLAGGVDCGTVARISGLKSAQELNGQLCQILRPGDSAPDRLVVRVRGAEKSLKINNLLFGARNVFPLWSGVVAALLVVLSFFASADLLLGTRSPLAAAAVPVLTMLWMVGTVGVLFWTYRPCRTTDVWVPSVSELGLYEPTRNVYRFGFLHVALLFAMTIWLYSELLLPNLAPPPAAGTPWHANAALLEEIPVAETPREGGDGEEADEPARELEGAELEEGGASTEDNDQELAPDQDGPSDEEGKDGNVTNTSRGTNITNVTGNMTAFLTWAPNRSVAWGYGAAAGVGLQGLVTFDGRFSIRSTVHLMGMGAFVVGTMQHSMQSTMVLLSSRGKPLALMSNKVKSSLRLRQNITSYGPLVLLGVPLGSQLMQMNKPAMQPQRMKSAVNILKESGLVKLVGLLQWALVAIYALFYSTFCVDFWFAAMAR